MTSTFSNTPPPPNAVGDTWTNPSTDVTYEWDGQRWIALDSHVHTETYVNRTGDTMLGPLISPNYPRSPSEVTNKNYVDDEIDKLGVEIAAIAIEKGGARNYQLTGTDDSQATLPGHMTLDSTDPTKVESISLYITDLGGATTRIPDVGDILELDRVSDGTTYRYVVTKAISGSAIDCELVGNKGNISVYTVGEYFTVYIYPQNATGVSHKELTEGLNLKVDRNGDTMTGAIDFQLPGTEDSAFRFSNKLLANSTAIIHIDRPYSVDDGPNVDGASRNGKGGLDIKINSSSEQNRIRFWGGSGANKEILDITGVNNGKGIKLYNSLGLSANNNTDQTIWARSGNRGHLNYRGTASTDQRLSWGESKVWISNAELDMQSNKIINVPAPVNDGDVAIYKSVDRPGPGICRWIYRDMEKGKSNIKVGEFMIDDNFNFFAHQFSANGINFNYDRYVTTYTVFPHFVIWRYDPTINQWMMVISGDVETQKWLNSGSHIKYEFRTLNVYDYTPAVDGDLCCLIVEQHFG